MTILAVLDDSIYDGYDSWDPFFGGLEDKPGSYNFEEMDVSRFSDLVDSIYWSLNVCKMVLND